MSGVSQNSEPSTGDLARIESYQHLYVVIEHEEGIPVPVSLEMLGEARRLMDYFNVKYSSNEKVVAVVLGDRVRFEEMAVRAHRALCARLRMTVLSSTAANRIAPWNVYVQLLSHSA